MTHTPAQRFEWDPAKDRASRRKHGIGFAEVTAIFESGDTLETFDEASSMDEERFISIGHIARGLVVVAWTERVDDVIRIISARFATKSEVHLYAQRLGGNP